jgi:hypothetical protein
MEIGSVVIDGESLHMLLAAAKAIQRIGPPPRTTDEAGRNAAALAIAIEHAEAALGGNQAGGPDAAAE